MVHGAKHASLGYDINTIFKEEVEEQEVAAEEQGEPSDNLITAADLVKEDFSQGIEKDIFASLEDYLSMSIEHLQSPLDEQTLNVEDFMSSRVPSKT